MILLTAVVVSAAILFVLAPLLGWGVGERDATFETSTPAATRQAELLHQRREILASIRDLDLEYEVGKLTREDFEQAREHLTRQAVEIYRQMDAHAGS